MRLQKEEKRSQILRLVKQCCFYEPKISLKESQNSLVEILSSIAATLRNKQSSGSLIVFKESISLSNSLYKFYVSRPIAATLRSGIVFNVVIF